MDTEDFPEKPEENPSAENSSQEAQSAISADLIRGHINTIILRTLYERDKYGYEIIEEIEQKSHGQYSLKQPTLYSALKRLESQGYINAYWKTDEVSLGGRRKYYTLTDSGREITEKNQAEWEYSRTVIDNLISDRSFDFTQPAPTSVDFKILKKSTSRVPVVKDGEDDDEDDEEKEKEEEKQPSEKLANKLPEVEIKPETVTYTEQLIYVSAPPVTATQTTQETPPVQPVQQPAQATVEQQQVIEPAAAQPVAQPAQQQAEAPVQRNTAMDEAQRKTVHENYLKLISEPVAPVQPVDNVVPVADNIDTEKLIYNNKPETERDYRNLINNLFDKTVKRSVQKQPTTEEPIVQREESPAQTVKIDDLSAKANSDGLKVNSSDYVINTRKKSYNRGGTLFKCSLIVAIILMLEFAMCLIFKDKLEVGLAYPFVIFSIAVAQLLIFGVLYYTDLSKITRKPSSALYLSACIIVTVICIFIIFIVSILLNVNFNSIGDIFAKIIIPCIVALNITVFGVCFYEFSK